MRGKGRLSSAEYGVSADQNNKKKKKAFSKLLGVFKPGQALHDLFKKITVADWIFEERLYGLNTPIDWETPIYETYTCNFMNHHVV